MRMWTGVVLASRLLRLLPVGIAFQIFRVHFTQGP